MIPQESFYKVLSYIENCPEQHPLVIAIDGRAASGKTTLGGLLSEELAAPLIHMDDFYVPAALRTEEREKEPGGWVHYERFSEEVLPGLREGKAFAYGIFSHKIMDVSEHREVPASPIYIVEGSYSLHPFFGSYASLRFFSDISEEEQLKRILLRNGPEKAERFKNEWIPKEEKYFSTFAIRDTAIMLG